MTIKDRTREFDATVESFVGRTSSNTTLSVFNEPLLGAMGSPTSQHTQRRSQHSEFTRQAAEINAGIQRILARLEKLAKLARNKTLFDDRPVEVQELTQIIKIDLAKLNSQISDLQNFEKMRQAAGYKVGLNRSAEEHSSQVVVSLQSRLAGASVSFTNVLEMRSQSIRAQKDRRDQFSATNLMPVSSASRQRSVRESPNKENQHVSIEMPSQSLQQLSLMTTASETSYLESRSSALQGIEATINELGTIYQQLATMVSEQGEVVQRIDMNVEDMHLNVTRGQTELMKYLRSVSSNRWLVIKIFAVLVVFVIFFSVFLN